MLVDQTTKLLQKSKFKLKSKQLHQRQDQKLHQKQLPSQLRNLLLITGDPGRVGEYPHATAVFDVDSIGLTNVVTRLNHGCDVGGQVIGAPTGFHVGVSVNPTASNLDEELRRFDYKVEAGAEFVLTRPIFDLANFERFLKRIEHARLPIVAGVFPLDSVRNAEFLANEVPGSSVPDALVERMRRSGGPPAF